MSVGGARWNPDGWDAGVRIGVLTPHADIGPESELLVAAPLHAIGGNGFRAVGVIAALESRLPCAVVTANQALLWGALRAAGADPSTVADYGRLFRHLPDPRAQGCRVELSAAAARSPRPRPGR